MRKIVFTTFLFFCIGTTFAQKSGLRRYYYWINKAELAIYDSAYSYASDCYSRAFRHHTPFGRHASQAFRLNCYYTGNVQRAAQCFHYLAQMGNQPSWYIEDTVKHDELWRTITIISDTTKSLVIPELHDELENIKATDQAVRRMYFDDEEEQAKAIRETDSLNLSRLIGLYKRYPVVNDYTAGMGALMTPQFIHYAKVLNYDPEELLLKEVLKGNIFAGEYVNLIDLCKCELLRPEDGKARPATIYGTNPTFFFIVDSVGFIIQPANIKEVNKSRKRISMSETWEDLAQKHRYRYKHETDFIFFPLKFVFVMPEDARRKIDDIDNGSTKGEYHIIPLNLR